MHTLDLWSDSTVVRGELDELAIEVRRTCPELPEPFRAPWSADPVAALDHRGHPWVITSVERDPQARRGRGVLPRPQRRRLERLAAFELPIRRLAVAHELDPTGPAAELVALLRTGPRTCTDELARALVEPVPAHPGVRRATRWLDAVVGGAGRAIAALDPRLDPVIFGIVSPGPPGHGRPCLWWPLCAWRW